MVNTLDSLGYDYRIDEYGFIVVDDGDWRIWCPEENDTDVVVALRQGSTGDEGAIVLNRISWPLKVMGLRVFVQCGCFTPRTRV